MSSASPSKTYHNGIPIRHSFKDPDELANEHPGATQILLIERAERAQHNGIFLDGFGIVSAAVFMDFRLRPMDKLVFSALKLFAGADGHTSVKINTLRSATNLGKQALRQSIKNLTECGYLQYATSHNKKGQRTRTEFICIDNPKKFQGNYTLKGKYRGEYAEFPMKFTRWGRVSKAVFCDENIDKYAKLVYVSLCILGSGSLVFGGKNAYISLFIGGISRENLQKALKELEDWEYIRIFHKLRWNKYAINIKPEHVPYPAMFFCNDLNKILKGKDNQHKGRISDVSSVVGENIHLEEIIDSIQKAQKFELGDIGKRTSAVNDDLEDDEQTDFFDYSVISEKEEAPAEPIPPKISKELETLLEECKKEDVTHPEADYGRNLQREIDLQAPEDEFQQLLSRLNQFLLYKATEDQKILAKLVLNGGIPVEYALELNEEKLLRSFELLMDAVPGIHTTMENKCLQQALDTLNAIATRKRTYRINGEPINMVDFIIAFNRVLSVDDSGVSMAGFLQYVAKCAANKLLCGDVQHFKTSIVHLMESFCKRGIRLFPVLESSTSYKDAFDNQRWSIWHKGRSCWATGGSAF